MDTSERLTAHYRHGNLEAALLEALRAAGRDVERMGPEDVMGADEFHIGGAQATRDLLAQLEVGPGTHVLDIGSGLGGPARHMAAATGCRVMGIDLSAEYVAVANSLTRRMGMAERVSFVQGTAEALEVPAEGFDGATLLHVGMNVADKASLFAAVRRALKPGGFFAVYDVMRVGPGEILFPVPWSSEAGTSFVEGPDAYRAALEGAGFRVTAERERAQFGRAFFAAMRARMAQAKAEGRAAPPGLQIVMGPGAAEKTGNMVAMLEAGTIAPVEMLARA
jgi:SAM-dependent methyltransferase